MIALGIDIGGTSVKAALLDGGEILATSAQGAGYARPTRDQLLRAIEHAVGSLPPARCDRVGVCAPGLFDPSTGRFTACVNVPGLVGLSLADLLRPARLDHASASLFTDAHAAAVDFAVTTRSAHTRALAISLGTGVGACVLDGATPLVFSGRSPGHFGQLDVSLGEEDPPIGPDGGRGGLEAYIGLPALLARFGCAPEDLPHHLGAMTRRDAPLRALARAVRIGHAMFRPDAVWLLGGVGLALAPVVGELRALTAEGLTSLARPDWVMRCGQTGLHAACGAARLANKGR